MSDGEKATGVGLGSFTRLIRGVKTMLGEFSYFNVDEAMKPTKNDGEVKCKSSFW